MRYAERLVSAGAALSIAAGASSADSQGPKNPDTQIADPFVQTIESDDSLLNHPLPEGIYIDSPKDNPMPSPVSSELENAGVTVEPVLSPETPILEVPVPTIEPQNSIVNEPEITPTPIVDTFEPTEPNKITVPAVASDGGVKENEQGPVSFETVLQRLNGGPTKSELFVINSQENLNEVYSQFNFGYGENEVPEVDFANKSVLVMFGGYRFTKREMSYINSIKDLGDKLEVEIVDIQPDFNNGACEYVKDPSSSYQIVVLDEKVNDLTPIERKMVVDNNCYDLVETENGVEKKLIEEKVENEIEFSSLLKNINGGLTKKDNLIIGSLEEWEIATQDLNNGHGLSKEVEIDFSSEYAVAVFRGYDFTQNVDIEIVNIIDKGDFLEVNIVNTSPDFSENPNSYEKNPSSAYHIVKIPGNYDKNKPVIFNEIEKVIKK